MLCFQSHRLGVAYLLAFLGLILATVITSLHGCDFRIDSLSQDQDDTSSRELIPPDAGSSLYTPGIPNEFREELERRRAQVAGIMQQIPGCDNLSEQELAEIAYQDWRVDVTRAGINANAKLFKSSDLEAQLRLFDDLIGRLCGTDSATYTRFKAR